MDKVVLTIRTRDTNNGEFDIIYKKWGLLDIFILLYRLLDYIIYPPCICPKDRDHARSALLITYIERNLNNYRYRYGSPNMEDDIILDTCN